MFDTGMADRLRAAGLTVVVVDGWTSAGGSSFRPRGVVCHHTAGAAHGDMPSLGTLINGRSDLKGPLANVGLARSGTCFVIAAGTANHAGAGSWRGLSGNSSVHGIEAESTGQGDWTDAQRDAYPRLAAALISATSADPDLVCAHREWTTRKPDPTGVDLDDLRARVAQLLASPGQPIESEDDMSTPLLVLSTHGAFLLCGSTLAHVTDPTNLSALPARIRDNAWSVTDSQFEVLREQRSGAPA